jgi:hypothetical protein
MDYLGIGEMLTYRDVNKTYHSPNAAMGHSVHNVDISKPLAHTMPYRWSAVASTAKFSKQMCAQNLREISFLSVWNISGIFYFSS